MTLRLLRWPGLGQRPTIEELYAKHAGVVHRRCTWLLHDAHEADDATQEVFTKAHETLHTLQDAKAALGWLLSIATRHCLNRLRARRAKWKDELEQSARHEPAHAPSNVEGLALVRSILEQFDEETQAIAVHYHVDELTLDEVAAITGRSVPTVRKRLATFAEEARRMLSDTPGATG